ncbi:MULTISPECIES: N-(5'-phosphoribosyl)anthranilate isomerase [unclassified Rathayibacter]|uniref:phosphoribosylanthranilate isomerase n=1 Tax=unclassified Rathayibacter TaxID=2609250 RepID=UPI00188CA36C|nr:MULTISPECIES: N-(5'-phosphoribosyl)anthranilate isomerase [unclassified Rathayibacter]MBF4463178.1 N-(5'-phosphoribosyl)anthranilate isomerase [Rathayibacter sp. VKM Ac-2879]MBF4504585.1 N-(5'-phosphoribosyl)anthranilate isomerase [Rathayibacter sp. VKM Ac-2878]
MVKVCGVVAAAELSLLAAAGATDAGVWWGVPGSPRSLSVPQLAAVARDRSPIRRALVTFSSDADGIALAAAALEADWIQLHAFQRPSVVDELRRRLADSGRACRVVKVLHLDGGVLLEAPFLGAYGRAGADGYLVDTVAGGRIGSTGVRADAGVLRRAVERLDRPFLVAGGLGARDADRVADLAASEHWQGIDVDGSARGVHGALDAVAVAALVDAWAPQLGRRAVPA